MAGDSKQNLKCNFKATFCINTQNPLTQARTGYKQTLHLSLLIFLKLYFYLFFQEIKTSSLNQFFLVFWKRGLGIRSKRSGKLFRQTRNRSLLLVDFTDLVDIIDFPDFEGFDSLGFVGKLRLRLQRSTQNS